MVRRVARSSSHVLRARLEDAHTRASGAAAENNFGQISIRRASVRRREIISEFMRA